MQYRPVIFFITFLILLLPKVNAQESPSSALITSATPEWIKPIQLPVPQAEQEALAQNGIYYLLLDKQIKADTTNPLVVYRRFSEKVINQNGLQSVSNINVNYDPSYETLKWHHFHIIRNGKIIDRQSDVRVSILHREKELENSIYNGRLTANIILSDLRVGDIVDYSYSIIGQNPIYSGHFSTMEYMEWAVPIGKSHFFLDWGKPQSLQYKALQTKAPINIAQVGKRTHYEYELDNILPKKSNSQAPSWYDPYGRYYFSDVATWQEVIEWAMPLYQRSIKTSPVIKRISADIKAQSESPIKQAALALHYVQDNVRYLGIEMGKNSHQPSLASDTLSRRYGDCKDKTVLLITLLRELGIRAAPALVDTDVRKELIHEIPSINAFDHVIVYLQFNGTSYWIDPTREYQKGDLEMLFQVNYGYSLVVDAEHDSLTEMKVPLNSGEIINEEFDISGAIEDPVAYTVRSKYRGLDSEINRSNFLDSNNAKKSDQYLNFYKSYYDHIRIGEDITYEDNPLTGVFQVTEKYLIQPFWSTDEEQKSTTTFYATGVSTALTKPDEIIRTAPYYVRPREIKENIKVKLDDAGWDFKDSRYEEKNDFFVFNRVVLFDKENKELNLEYYFKTVTDTIAPDDVPAYLAARKKVLDEVEYSIYTFSNVSSEGEASTDAFWQSRVFWFGVFGLIYVSGLILLISNWYTDKSRFNYLSTTKFYPISPFKFVFLSVVTIGMYVVYWFYRNWSYIRQVDKSTLLPFWRSVFSCFWFYPFFRRLISGEESQDVAYLPKTKWFAIILAVCYLLFSLLSSADMFGFLFQWLLIAICLLLVIHISKIPQENDFGYKNNSRWLFRHSLLVVVCLPLFLLLCGQEAGLLPNSDVVSGKRLYAHNIRFLQRHKIIPAKERVLYFYSGAFLNLHQEGNGFTEKTVFSYWHDDEGRLAVKSIAFSQINSITENQDTGFLSAKILNLVDDQGDEFNLYLGSSASKNKLFIKRIRSQWQQERVRRKS
jgi:transglutaminase-like putative cysteine protease